jgi:predicted peptidase
VVHSRKKYRKIGKMKNIRILIVGFCVMLLSACSTLISVKEMRITHHKAQKDGYQYAQSLPLNYDKKAAKLPVIVFLHGSGERGNDLNKVSIHGPLRLIREGRELPFIIIAPQSPEGQNWDTSRLDKTLNSALKGLNADEKRIYLTGLSRGGLGVWNWTIAQPNKFAAIAPVAGWSNAGGACEIAKVPTWVFHGEKDDVVRIFHSEDMVKQMKNCGGEPLFTRYPEANHDSWTQTYFNQELYDWFLQHTSK